MSYQQQSDVLERFLRYVQVNTQSSDANCDQVPSSACQFDLANLLADELCELGALDVAVSEHAYVTAHIPASAGAEDRPALGLIAHLDTTEVAPGAGVKPHIVSYAGGDLVCGTVDGKPVALTPESDERYSAQTTYGATAHAHSAAQARRQAANFAKNFIGMF